MTSNEVLDDVLHLACDVYCWFDEQGRFLSCSDSMFEYLPELKPILISLAPYSAMLHGVTRTHMILNLPKEASEDHWVRDQTTLFLGTAPLSYKNHLHDGRSLIVKRVVINDGRRLLLFNDITSECQERRARALSEEKFKQFAKLSSNWFWGLDADLCYLYHSSHQQPLTGVNAASLVGKSRIIKLDGMVKNDDQLRQHNGCLLAKKDVDVVLTWERPDGETIFSHVLAQPQYDKSGVFNGYLGCGRDVTSFYELKQQYEYQANHDYLTKLLNRRAFERVLQEEIYRQGATPSSIECGTLLTIDLDRFKLVNDEGGHSAGDQLLIEIAGLLTTAFAKPAAVARLGGDEFGVYMPGDKTAAVSTAQSFIDNVGKHVFNWNGRAFSIGASVGIAEIVSADTLPSDLLRDADSACYAAKRLGRNQAQVFSEKHSFLAHERVEADTLRRLKLAVEEDRLALYLQPIVATAEPDNVIKYEVLLRILDESGDVIAPGEFIPVAEKYDVMQDIDLIVVEHSLSYLREFHERGAFVAFAINLSGNSLSNASVLQRIVDRVKENQDLANSICFEITETAAINSLALVIEHIEILRNLGCTFALDDFGTGLSSYNYLNSLKVDYLKIDGSFIKSMLDEPSSMAIVKSINTLSHEMNMCTVAEHVSDLKLVDALIDINVDYLQGFYYGKPTAIEDVLSATTTEAYRTGTNN